MLTMSIKFINIIIVLGGIELSKVKKGAKAGIKADIIGLILITISILALYSILNASDSGYLGAPFKKILSFLFGIGIYFFPVIILITGIFYILKEGNLKVNKRFIGIILFAVNTLLFIQMITLNNFYRGDLLEGIANIYKSKSIVHGGFLSLIIDVPLYKLIGKICSYIIYVGIYSICIILISSVKIKDAFKELKGKSNAKSKKEIITDNKTPKKPIENEFEEKKDFIDDVNRKIKIVNFMRSNSKSFEEEPASTKEDDEKEPIEANSSEMNEEFQEEIDKNKNNGKVFYKYPPVDILNQNISLKMNKEDKKELIGNASKLEDTLSSFGVEAKVVQVAKGPSVTRFELQPSAGVKVSKIVNLADDIALNLAASGVRIEAPIPGKAAVGIEVPNKELMPVFLREVIESPEFVNSSRNLCFALGKDIAGNCMVSDLAKMPHLLIAGATGSGKSVCINTLIISILYKYSPLDVKLLMIDPKVVELSIYNGIPHLLIPVVTDPKKAAGALCWAVTEMTNRYKTFANANVRNIEGYNELYNKGKVSEKMPLIVIIIDELADLMMVCAADVEDYIGRLAQMARAAGMHLVIATQRPSVDVITGVIKANIPSRISFAVSSQIDSRTILDMAGAEKLLGKGDMLFYPVGESKPLRIQGAFISEEEVENVVNFINENCIKEEDKEGKEQEILKQIDTGRSVSNGESDELIDEAIGIVVESGQASTSLLQRKLRIGYNRAARLMEELEEKGVISERDGSKPRQILIDKEEYINKNYFNK